MNRDAAIRLLDRLHRAQNDFYAGGSGADLQQLLASEITWTVPGDNRIAGTYRGVDEVLDYFGRRRDLADRTFQMKRRDVLAGDGNRVAVLRRRLRQAQVEGELTFPEVSALSRLDRGGPATSAALARLEQITPQSMGATLGGLEGRGLVERAADPRDGRRVILSITEAGTDVLRDRRNARVQQLAQALSTGFTPLELEQLLAAAPLLERLAQSI
jgi:DNA-binding MarR family transcriptional regulator